MDRRFSFDDLEAMLPSLDNVSATPPPLTEDVQQSIDHECRKQAHEMAWQTEMNAKVLRSRQEHERRRRQQAQALAKPGGPEGPDTSDEDTTELDGAAARSAAADRRAAP
eukprot:SAG11_NODE_27756_length_329_cov_0.986957_1_plen_109_part_11